MSRHRGVFLRIKMPLPLRCPARLLFLASLFLLRGDFPLLLLSLPLLPTILCCLWVDAMVATR